ncbi:MAG TPA: FAD-binding oxidoreductase [Solirubrobacteraceae bacterium]
MNGRRRKHWGWGFEDQQPTLEQARAAVPVLSERLRIAVEEVEEPVALEQVVLAPPRVAIPPELAELCTADAHARASHALGKSYTDVVRGFRGSFESPPDFVVRPRGEQDLERILEWCSSARVAAIPFGGGTSVVGGVTPQAGPGQNGAVSIDLAALDGLLELDDISRSARIGAGTTGPALEAALAERGMTLRHFPQSFEYSTLGGWIATRAGGHFATLWTHIEDFLESARAITPAGAWESRRLPGSGAGPSPDRLLAGSEGILGVITSAWVRVQPRPRHRASAGLRFETFLGGADCVRELSQSGLHPSNCRLLDAGEAGLTMAGDGNHALLVLGFESTDHPVEEAMERALAICDEHGGAVAPRRGDAGGDAVESWRGAFIGAPYVRDLLVAMGVISETFETAITWERFPALHARVMETAREAVREACGEGGSVFCRFTHVYPDGPAPYFTVLAPARRGEEIEQWSSIKRAVSEVLIEQGATITHHHAVGRDHRPWYDRQRPDPFAAALRGAKAALDPAGVMNPGVLLDALG